MSDEGRVPGEGPAEVAFSLGSNLGDKAGNIAAALRVLAAAGIADGLVCSSLYRTLPWGDVPAQDWYVNACAVGTTALPAPDLLRRIKAAEVALGRVASVRWGPRHIDIDILFRGTDAVRTPDLVLPHPRMMDRAFVLVPLAELVPDRMIGGLRVAEAAGRADRTGVVRL